jgi:hypothetical protein
VLKAFTPASIVVMSAGLADRALMRVTGLRRAVAKDLDIVRTEFNITADGVARPSSLDATICLRRRQWDLEALRRRLAILSVAISATVCWIVFEGYTCR